MPARTSDEVRAAIAADVRAHPEDAIAVIARRHGVSATLVRTIARAEGVRAPAAALGELATARTEKAVRARMAQLGQRRAALAERLLARAEALERSLDQQFVAFNFGGKDNTYNEHTFDKPDVKSAQIIITTAAIALDKHFKILQFDAGTEGSEAASLLGQLGSALAERFGDGGGHRAPALDLPDE